jgi:hypothetical protein
VRFLSRPSEGVPTAVDITPAMLDRATTALMASEAEHSLTNIYGRVERPRAREHALRVLEAALDLRWEGGES